MNNLKLSLLASLTLGLAPFFPEPHLIGKLRWIAGGGVGMETGDYLDLAMHGLPWLLFLFFAVKFFIDKNKRMNIQEILKEKNVHLIDVREKYEFDSGSIDDAINMPLSQFGSYLDQIKAMPNKKILFCRSGGRSGQAADYLKKLGITEVYNGGGLHLMQSYMIAN